MFTQPAPGPSTPGLQVAAVSSITSATSTVVSPVSPTPRSSRLRGLSYLRNYTHSHLLNRDHSSTGATASGANSAPQQPLQSPSPNACSNNSGRPTDNLTRSVSYSPGSSVAASSSTSTSTASAAAHHRLSLAVPTALQPLASSATASADISSRSRLSAQAELPPTANPDLSSQLASEPVTSAPTAQTSLISCEAASPSAAALATAAAAASLDGTSSSTMTRTRSATEAGLGQPSSSNADFLPSIRFSAFYDPRATRPSLTFSPVSRTLPTGGEVIRVGRYSERDSQPNVPINVPSAAPVGFKSKVVSRRHCEFWYEGGRWYIKDVKSSSGTFLNHIRLSQPNTESKPFPVNDGDIVQLGIDFKGGEEMIFRCVKMRLELNRGWQNKLNAFNVTTHKRLRNMTRSGDASSSTQSSQDCSICLNSIAPCQCLFVAPCSHTWHYKCIRSLLASPQYPIFICPNCRAAADLEAEVEDPEEWEQMEAEDSPGAAAGEPDGRLHEVGRASAMEGVQSPSRLPPSPPSPPQHPDMMDVTMQVDSRPAKAQLSQHLGQHSMATSHATSEPRPILTSTNAPAGGTHASTPSDERQTRTPSPTGAHHLVTTTHEGPITPRNDAGPWVFDGSGVRARLAGRASTDSRRGEMRNLDTAAAEIASHVPA